MKVKRWSPIVLGATLVAVLGLGSLGTAEQSLPPTGGSQPDGAAEPARAVARVHNLTLQKSARAVTILIHASGPLSYRTLMLSDPTRLVVDLPETVLQARRRHIAIDSVSVVGVRTAQFRANPPVTRVVVDLLDQVKYEIEPFPRGLKLTLLQPAPVEPVPVTEAPEPEIPILLASLAPVIPARTAAALPPLASVPVEEAAGSTLTASKLDAAVPAAAPARAQETPASTSEEQLLTPKPSPRYTGEPISVNLKDVDLKDFFRLIHEISGLNIVLDPAVSGTVTLVLDEVPWDQALDLVLKNNNLDKEFEGNVLRIATVSTLKREEEDRRDLARARAEAVDPVTTTRVLSYAKAGDLEATLRRFLSSRGEIIRDDRTNTLIIRDIPNVLPQLDNLIRQLDRKSPQVEIEARVVTASRSFAREIGSQMAFSTAYTRGGGAGTAFGGSTTIGDSGIEGGPGVPVPPFTTAGTLAPPLVSSFPASVDILAGAGFTIAHRQQNFALDLIITAAESRGVGKLLSKPRVITQNNIQAQVQQGVRIPVQTVVNNTITTQFINVVLSLKVTPHITADGTIFLDIDVENTAINPGIARINGIPALDTQQATTQVLVNDGGTVVIGGVMTTETSFDINQVPFLGSVPIIGHLFKRTSTRTRSQELLFFITPRVLPS
ncbi:MAG: type IV pilus secretin PilQ [Acidobacteria bacterium]|nr:type IV pilus secretin PilQ [Acidobacteriota bacterium]